MLQTRSNFAPTIEPAARTEPADSPSPASSDGMHGEAIVVPKRTGGLVLTRHVEQSIMIGDDIAVEVVDVRASAVRLRVVAPREVPVHRREVFDAIRTAPRAEPAPARADRPEPAPHRGTGGGGGLVLTRHAEQSIMIGDDIEVEVVGMKGGTVRLRILAPREVAVHRLEIYDAIHA